ncbi:MAG: hypothetical protein ACP5P9_07140 [Acidimicrobiales bacterium]
MVPEVASVGSEVPGDAELTELALAADPNLPIADDARSVAEVLGWPTGGLPAWYAPATVPGARQRRKWQRAVVVALVGTFVVLEALGLCTVFGHLVVG